MDTKKKKRPEEPKRRSRSNAKANQSASRRPEKAPQKRQRPADKAARTDHRREQPSRRPEETVRRTRESVRETEGNIQQQIPVQTQNAPEMVFRMDGKEERKKRPAQDPAEVKRAQQRRRSAQRTQERKKQASHRSKAPKVVYTQPRPFNANRLMLQLAMVMAVVLAISLGLSVFFKVEQVMVYGNHAYSAWTVQEASGIEGGEKLLSFGNIRACGKIKAALPYVETVRIGINLPDTVNIYITEYDVAYAIKSQNGTWWLMTSDGRVVEQTDSGTATSYTKVLGVELDNPSAGEQAIAYESALFETEATEATTAEATTEPPVTVTAGERLNAALVVLEALERNDLVGAATSVDVTSLNNIELWYGNQYQVRLGTLNDSRYDLDYKISSMKSAIAQLSDYQTGILDVSFVTWEDQAGYTPFS